ncbi:MAG: SGNH/GDSL hydrolase family protein, partial [Thermoanaerobaculia bacterium]
MKNIHRIASIVLATAPALAVPLFAQGRVFGKFVAVGDSLAAGEESLCIVERFQERSWVKVVADQLRQSDFQQPLFAELPATNPLTGYPCLGPVFDGVSISVSIVSEQDGNQNSALGRPYDNLGFNGSPHIKDFVDLKTTVPGRSDLDNKAASILRNCEGCPFAGMSAVDQANSLAPDLVGFWGGNNDALDALGAGVAIEGVTLTPVDAFAAKYEEVIKALSALGRMLVVFNIGDLGAIPFATTIPPVVVNPATRQPVIVDGHVVPLLGPGDDAFPCEAVGPTDPACPLPPGTLVTLSASPLLAQGIGIPASLGGTGLPLPHGTFTPPATLNPGVILYPDDVTAIRSHIDGYNAAITASASANGAILVDVHALFDRIASEGFTIGGLTVTKSFLTGGIFSYDGVHPSAIGYGIIADEFIKAVNAAAGTDIPRPNFSQILFTPNVPALPGHAGEGPAA